MQFLFVYKEECVLIHTVFGAFFNSAVTACANVSVLHKKGANLLLVEAADSTHCIFAQYAKAPKSASKILDVMVFLQKSSQVLWANSLHG
jgi:hypothetical protein